MLVIGSNRVDTIEICAADRRLCSRVTVVYNLVPDQCACEDQFKLQIHWQRRIRLSESPYLFQSAETSLFPIWDKKLIWVPMITTLLT